MVEGSEDWQMGNAGVEAAAAGGRRSGGVWTGSSGGGSGWNGIGGAAAKTKQLGVYVLRLEFNAESGTNRAEGHVSLRGMVGPADCVCGMERRRH